MSIVGPDRPALPSSTEAAPVASGSGPAGNERVIRGKVATPAGPDVAVAEAVVRVDEHQGDAAERLAADGPVAPDASAAVPTVATGRTVVKRQPVPALDDAGLPVAVAALKVPATLEQLADDDWNPRTLTNNWLRRKRSRHTREAYWRDLRSWLTWCAETSRDVYAVKSADADAYLSDAAAEGLAVSTIARRASAASSWYDYLVANEAATRNPFTAAERPDVDKDHSTTIGLSGPQLTAFMATARAKTGYQSLRNTTLLGLLAELALRVSEATGADIADLGHDGHHRILLVTRKGGKRQKLPIPGPLGRDIDTYLEARAAAEGVPIAELTGPLLVTRTGKRLDRVAVLRTVRTIAKAAGIPQADKLSAHSLRHALITAAFDAEMPLRDVQDLAGHADPRTTRRYDRNRRSLDKSIAYRMAHLFAHTTTDDDEDAAA